MKRQSIAIGYIRISKKDPKSLSLAYQEEQVRRTAEANGFILTHIECDDGISAKDVKSRPAAQRVLRAVSQKEVHAVVVFKSDRIARNGIESLQIEALFNQCGVAYLSCIEGRLADGSAEDEFLGFVRAGLNQRERKMISLRTKAALDHKRELGDRVGGKAPFGYQWSDGGLIVNPEENDIMAMITRMRKAGHPYSKIASTLQAAGKKTRKGTTFSVQGVHKLLQTKKRGI